MNATLTLWNKHMLKFVSNREETLGLLLQPILLVALFGAGMRAMIGNALPLVGDYMVFIVPGIITVTVLTGAIAGGATLLDERLRGILKEYLVAPIPRLSILAGNALSTVTKALVQAVVVTIIGILAGAKLAGNPAGWLAGFLGLALYAVGFAGVALAFAARARSTGGYHALIFVLNFPLLFASNALYPLAVVPVWMQALGYLNPTTYVIDVVRATMFGRTDTISPLVALLILVLFAVAGMWLALRAFERAVRQ